MAPDIDRRGFLRCMAWAGTGVVWTVSGGVLSGCELGAAQKPAGPKTKDLYFVQISALAAQPAFVMHTGDLTHTSTPDQFDTVKQMLGTIKTGSTFQVPGEH